MLQRERQSNTFAADVEIRKRIRIGMARAIHFDIRAAASRASSQCGLLRKYSSDFAFGTSSIRNGMMISPLLTARSTSRRTCTDSLEREECEISPQHV